MTPAFWVGLEVGAFAVGSAIFGYGFWMGKLKQTVQTLDDDEGDE